VGNWLASLYRPLCGDIQDGLYDTIVLLLSLSLAVADVSYRGQLGSTYIHLWTLVLTAHIHISKPWALSGVSSTCAQFKCTLCVTPVQLLLSNNNDTVGVSHKSADTIAMLINMTEWVTRRTRYVQQDINKDWHVHR
jgi:hypothetical protein